MWLCDENIVFCYTSYSKSNTENIKTTLAYLFTILSLFYQICYFVIIHSLCPTDAIWWLICGSPLAPFMLVARRHQVITYKLMAFISEKCHKKCLWNLSKTCSKIMHLELLPHRTGTNGWIFVIPLFVLIFIQSSNQVDQFTIANFHFII